MMANRMRMSGLGFLASIMLAACVTVPAPVQEVRAAPVAEEKIVKVDETAMLPLLGYFQLLYRLSPKELARERTMLAAIPQTPSAHVRMSMLLGQTNGPQDLARALSLMEGVLKSSDPAASSLHPLARALAIQYNERLRIQTQSEKLQMQNEKFVIQNGQLDQQLKESSRRNGELQEKLDALADIERSLPVRPANGQAPPGAAR